MDVSFLSRGFSWLDTGTMDSLIEASDFVRTMQKQQGIIVSAPEEIAWRKGWISSEQLLEQSKTLIKAARKYNVSSYGKYLGDLIEEEEFA